MVPRVSSSDMPAVGSSRKTRLGFVANANANSSFFSAPLRKLAGHGLRPSGEVAKFETLLCALGADQRCPAINIEGLAHLRVHRQAYVLAGRHAGKDVADLEGARYPRAGDAVRRPARDISPIESHGAGVGTVVTGLRISKNVVLPAPFGPMIASSLLFAMSNDMSWVTKLPPKCFCKPRTSRMLRVTARSHPGSRYRLA